jgi:WD40 repeat protein
MPPARAAPGNAQQLRSGPATMGFDCSASLLAVVLDDAPSTLWIWDVAVSELRAALMFHSEISSVEWHPTQSELLFVRCGGDSYDGIVFAWDPLSGGPRTIDFRSHLPQAKGSGRSTVSWLSCELEAGVLFYSDTKSCLLCSLADADREILPWGGYAVPTSSVNRGQAAESPVDPFAEDGDERGSDMDEGASQLEDTFEFKNFSGA